jgi:hypothetical protein
MATAKPDAMIVAKSNITNKLFAVAHIHGLFHFLPTFPGSREPGFTLLPVSRAGM